VFCNDRNFVFNNNVEEPFGSNDHGVVSFNVIRHTHHIHFGVDSFDFKNAVWTNLSVHFDCVDYFSSFENCSDTKSIFSAFHYILYNGLKEFVPIISRIV